MTTTTNSTPATETTTKRAERDAARAERDARRAAERERAMASTVATAAEVGKAIGAGGPVIGAICFWTLGDVHVSRDAIRAKMAELDLLAAVPRDPSPSALLSRACDDAKRGRKDIVFDRVSRSATETVVALSRRIVYTTTEQASYEHVTRVRVAHGDGSLTFEDSSNAVMAELGARYSDMRAHMTTAEFGGMIGQAFQGRTHELLLGGVNLRGRSGGVYFVPAAVVERATGLADFVNATGSCSMTVWPIAAGDRALAQAAVAARSDIQERVREIRADIATFAAGLEAAGLVLTDHSVKTRLSRFESLSAKAALYAEVLGSAKADLEAEIEAACVALRDAVLGQDFSAFNDAATDAAPETLANQDELAEAHRTPIAEPADNFDAVASWA